jgi:amino acid permease
VVEFDRRGVGVSYTDIWGLEGAVRVRACSIIKPEGMGGVELWFSIVKLGAVCVYPCPYMLVIACCGIPRLGAEPSMVVRLWKWFIDWAEGFDFDVPPANGPLVYGLN